MSKKKRVKEKTLEQLKEDRQKCINDLQKLQTQQVMIQGIVAYLDNEIKKLEVSE